MKTIPILDLYAQYQTLEKKINAAIKNVIKDSAYIGGKYVDNFEKQIAEFLGAKYAVSLNSGTDALYLALLALGIKTGDEVITTTFTFFATSEVILRVGAKPVLIDIDPETFNLHPDLIEEKITKKTKAILPVHLFGLPARMDKIIKLAKKYHLYVIEDACQAIGAKYQNMATGTIGDVGCFSFFPSKNLGAYGDGGMLVTNNSQIADFVRTYKNHGSKIKYFNEIVGIGSRLDGIQAAILSVKLKYLEKWNQKRREVAASYNRLLKHLNDYLVLPNCSQKIGFASVYHQYTIRVKNNMRDGLRKFLQDKGIQTMIYYPLPQHLLLALKFLKYKKGEFPEAEKAASEVLSLPIYPELKKSQILQIGKLITQYFENQ